MCFQLVKMASLWDEVASLVPDIAVLRRLLFAAAHIPSSLPMYPQTICEFAFQFSKHKPQPHQVRVLLENLALLNEKAFDTDKVLFRDLLQLDYMRNCQPGIVLISLKFCLQEMWREFTAAL